MLLLLLSLLGNLRTHPDYALVCFDALLGPLSYLVAPLIGVFLFDTNVR